LRFIPEKNVWCIMQIFGGSHAIRAPPGKIPRQWLPGMELQIESESFDPDGHFLFWKPGSPPIVEPAGLALRLDPGNDLLLKRAFAAFRQSRIHPAVHRSLFHRPAGYEIPVLLQVDNDRALDIPAGDSNFLVSDEFTLPEDVQLLAIYPHAHYLAATCSRWHDFPMARRKRSSHRALGT